jgi:hypothetical protein
MSLFPLRWVGESFLVDHSSWKGKLPSKSESLDAKWSSFDYRLALALSLQVGAPKPSLELKVVDGPSSAVAREALWIYFCNTFLGFAN